MLNLQATLRAHRTDVILCLFLGAATIVYLMLRRVSLGSADEAYYFYHAVRMLEGQALYRDVFELTTPFLMDLLSLAFHLFGPTFTTGRVVGSVIQAMLLIAIYAGVRINGGGRMLAAAIAAVQLAMGQPAWPYTTPHWLAVLLLCALLLLAMNRQRGRNMGSIALQGLLLGLLLATRQHAGIAVGVGMALLVFADEINDRRWGAAKRLQLGQRLLTLAVATLIGASLILGPHLIQSGFWPMFNQLVIHPLTGYRENIHTTWGTTQFFEHAAFTWPVALKYLPVAVAITALRASVAWLRRSDRRTFERLLVLSVFGSMAIAYTMSYPDTIHLAMILPVILIVTGELLTAVLRTLGRWGPSMQTLVGFTLMITCIVQLENNYAGAIAKYPIMHSTDFGRLPFASAHEVEDVEWTKDKLLQSSSHDLFCYPGWPAIYLMTGAQNPTKHELIYPEYQRDEEIQQVIQTLKDTRVRTVILVPLFIKPNDPVEAYVDQHFDCIERFSFQFCERHN